MARTRLINPAAPLDEDVARLSMAARLLWAYLPCHADREGRMKDSSFSIKASVFPSDDVDVNALLSELADAGHIVRYLVEGRRYIQIRNFAKYQSPHKNEASSSLPPVPLAIPRESSSNYTSPRSHPVSDPDPVIDPVPGISPSACDPSATEQVAVAHEAIPDAVASAIAEDSTPARRPFTGVSLARLFGAVRTEVFGGMGWEGTRCNPEAAASRASQIEANNAGAEVRRTMEIWWNRVKAGEVDRAQECAEDDALSFGCWWGKFRGLRDQVLGVAPVIQEVRAIGPPRQAATNYKPLHVRKIPASNS